VLDVLESSAALADRVMENARRFRQGMTAAGFRLRPGFHPIVPIMMSGPRAQGGGDGRLAQEVASAMLSEGVLVTGFSYPVVPVGQARIRVQLSAAHSAAHVDHAVAAFARVGRSFELV
jgi:glycine C-acetyltransferase